jgi:cell division protein FtsI/penicillin-binding protein 2
MKSLNLWRFLSVQIFLALLGMGVVFQMVRIQVSPEAKDILENVEPYSGSWVTYYPPRGEIYDRQGHLLAGNETVYEVGVDLNTLKDAHTVALALNVNLGLDYAEVYKNITQPDEGIVYVVVADYVPADKMEMLMKLRDSLAEEGSQQSLTGLFFQPHLQRSYPEGKLAANVLGFVTRERRGYFGVEEKYNSLLAGAPVMYWVPSDPNRVKELPHVQPGATLILTIDREIQAVVENILDNAVEANGAESGTIVIMDPKTGEIMAMATTPRLDPNEYWTYADIFPRDTPYNRAISQAYEPGSVMKILTMAAALDSGTVQPNTRFFDNGYINVGGGHITNWDQLAHGDVNMTECLELSLNVCLAHVAVEMGNENFYTYMQRFGLGHMSGIDLAGEASGRLKLPGDGDWYPVDLGTNSFGQGVAMTPIQMLMAASAIANNGQMVAPHVLYALVQNGKQHNIAPQIVGTPISETTARALNQMLEASLKGEVKSQAVLEGYHLAGKTGTAQIPTPQGYTADVTNTSFIGWGPLTDPRFVVYVWIEKPSSSIWGSVVAAPVFRQVAEQLVIMMNIPPDDPSPGQ